MWYNQVSADVKETAATKAASIKKSLITNPDRRCRIRRFSRALRRMSAMPMSVHSTAWNLHQSLPFLTSVRANKTPTNSPFPENTAISSGYMVQAYFQIIQTAIGRVNVATLSRYAITLHCSCQSGRQGLLDLGTGRYLISFNWNRGHQGRAPSPHSRFWQECWLQFAPCQHL